MHKIPCTLLTVAVLAGVANAQNQSFTTILDSRSSIRDAGTLAGIGQVVLQDDNAVAALVRLGPTGTLPYAVTFSASPGNSAAQIVAQSGQPHATFGVAGGGDFDELYNLSSVSGLVTFAASETDGSGRGLFRYTYDVTSPARSAIHFAGNAISGDSATLDTGFGLPTYGVNTVGHVVFGARSLLALPAVDPQLIARHTGGAGARRIHSASDGIRNFNLPDSYVSTRKVLTTSGHAVFVGDVGDGLRRIYEVVPTPASSVAQVRVDHSLEAGLYEPQRLLAATGDANTGTTLFHAYKNRPAPLNPLNPPNDDWQQGALLVQSPAGLVEVASFDLANGAATPDMTATMSDNGRVAAFIPDLTGGRIVYYDVVLGGAPTTIAGFGTDVGDGYAIKELAIDAGSVPMVNARGTVVFDAVISNEGGVHQRDALLAWTPGSDAPFVIAKSGDTITIGGEDEVIGQLGEGNATFAPFTPFPSELAYDADVLKDGLNENDYLAFGVHYDNGAGTAILLTHIPEPSAATLLIATASATLLHRKRGENKRVVGLDREIYGQKKTAVRGRASRTAVGGESENRRATPLFVLLLTQ